MILFPRLLFSVASCVCVAHALSIVTEAGDKGVILGWQFESSQKVTADPETISNPDFDTSLWLDVEARSTVFAGLLQNGLYDDNSLFFSDSLENVNSTDFQIPWLFRNTFSLEPQRGQRYFLQTHGITSRAQIHLNGVMIADKDTQVGSYGGLKFDITDHIKKGNNGLLVTTYPTSYLRDFAMGFIDWNPYPPDNGTGIWRDVEILQTGQVSISPPRVTAQFDVERTDSAAITIISDVVNYGIEATRIRLEADINFEDIYPVSSISEETILSPGEHKTFSLTTTISDPEIWWPATWGSQPLYKASTRVYTSNSNASATLSDASLPHTFGIRKVSSDVNPHNDTVFFVNGHPFQVLSAGYTSDIFMRFSLSRLESQFRLALSMGLNTIRLEGKQEHPELYDLASRMGIMLLAGWECCDKWEGWTYNDDAAGEKWTDVDYDTAKKAMRHEAEMMQAYPAMLGFLVGSDYWPDDRATNIYVDALEAMNWSTPIIASAAKRGYPERLGPSGMKMEGPYDWVPPNYWTHPSNILGGAFGFGSELGAGVGTPSLSSLQRFLSPSDLNDLWTQPDKGLFHMSTAASSFHTRSIYNAALYARYGAPTSLDDYLLKTVLSDYEATRAQFEAYASRKSAERPATGLVYWMLNGAWPSLHWQLFDYYLAPLASFYGVQAANQAEGALLDQSGYAVSYVSQRLDSSGERRAVVDMIALDGTELESEEWVFDAEANAAKTVGDVVPWISKIPDVALVRVVLYGGDEVLSRNVYWIPQQPDVLDWENSTWYYTPVSRFADMSALFDMQTVNVSISVVNQRSDGEVRVVIENGDMDVPAFFVRLVLVDEEGEELTQAVWSENYVTLWPGESLEVGVDVRGSGKPAIVRAEGVNVCGVEVLL